MSRTRTEIRYVDADVPPAANYVGGVVRWDDDDMRGTPTRVQRPPLTGHVHLRLSDRCIHNDAGPLCPPLTRGRR